MVILCKSAVEMSICAKAQEWYFGYFYEMILRISVCGFTVLRPETVILRKSANNEEHDNEKDEAHDRYLFDSGGSPGG